MYETVSSLSLCGVKIVLHCHGTGQRHATRQYCMDTMPARTRSTCLANPPRPTGKVERERGGSQGPMRETCVCSVQAPGSSCPPTLENTFSEKFYCLPPPYLLCTPMHLLIPNPLTSVALPRTDTTPWLPAPPPTVKPVRAATDDSAADIQQGAGLDWPLPMFGLAGEMVTYTDTGQRWALPTSAGLSAPCSTQWMEGLAKHLPPAGPDVSAGYNGWKAWPSTCHLRVRM